MVFLDHGDLMVLLDYPIEIKWIHANHPNEFRYYYPTSAKDYVHFKEYIDEFGHHIVSESSTTTQGVYNPPFVSVPDPTQYITNPDGTTTYINPINSLVNPPSVVSTSQTTPLISAGVAEKLKEAGFETDLIDPLTKTEWTSANVEHLLDASRDLGIPVPSDIKPETLVITPVEEVIVNKTTNISPNKLNPIALVGLGLGILYLSKKV